MSKLSNSKLLVIASLLIASASAPAAETDSDGLVALRPLGAPIIENGRISGQLRVVMKIVPATSNSASEITGKAQAWQAKLLAALNEFTRLNVSIYRPVDAVKLRAALLASLKEGGAEAKDVLLLDVVAY